jgi:hypothetical protein
MPKNGGAELALMSAQLNSILGADVNPHSKPEAEVHLVNTLLKSIAVALSATCGIEIFSPSLLDIGQLWLTD